MHRSLLQRVCLSLVFIMGLAPLAGRCDVLETQGEYRLAIKVIPRLGAFDADLFKESRNKDCAPDKAAAGKMEWEAYRQLLDKTRAPLNYTLPNDALTGSAAKLFKLPAWDILTTSLPGKEAECSYAARRVMVTVLVPGGENPQSCELSMPGAVGKVTYQRGAGFCAAHAALKSNLETPVAIKVRLAQGGEVQLKGQVPEDVLIVSLGDSFASGEGNPDAGAYYKLVQNQAEPGSPPESVLMPALWMDPWCHRSAYAGPIRAGMKLIRHAESVSNERYRPALEAGAMTIVSFACSGGKLSDSLLGSYPGVQTRQDVMKERKVSDYTGKDPVLDTVVTMQPQIEQLHTFLSRQGSDPERRKKSIDLLLLSGGGNDVLFGPLMVKMMLANLATEEKKKKLLFTLDNRFEALQKDYNRFADTFRGNVFRLNNDEFAVRSIVSVLYPDFASLSAKASCTNTSLGNTDGMPGEGGNWLTKASQMLFGKNELDFVRSSVLKRLNLMLVETAARHQWRTLDVSRNGQYAVNEHGWCSPGGKPYYAEQKRWFRAPQDSVALQNNLNGTYHPTWEFNEKIMGDQVADEFVAAVNAEPDWRKVRVQPAYQAGTVTVTSARPVISYAGAAIGPVCQKIFLAGQTEPFAELGGSGCAKQPKELPGVHGASFRMVREARHRDYQREYARTTLGDIRVDALPPKLECRAGAGPLRPCGSVQGWARERRLTVRATDADAGMEALTVTVTSPTSQRHEIPVIREADGALQGVIDFPEDGVYTISACATDRVQNQTGSGDGCEVRFSHAVDSTPLLPLSLVAYGVDWLDSNAPADFVPVIPLFGAVSGSAMVRVQFRDDASGPAPTPDCPLVGGTTCLLALDAPAVYWQKKVFSKTYIDGAGNSSTFSYGVVRIPRFQAGKLPRSADEWMADAASDELVQGLRAALWIEPSLSRLLAAQTADVGKEVEVMLSETSSQAARKNAARAIIAVQAQRNLLSQWLNVLHGYQYAEAEVAPGVTELCAVNAGDAPAAVHAYQALQMQTRCALKSVAAAPASGEVISAGISFPVRPADQAAH